jgi:hypothetical protein
MDGALYACSFRATPQEIGPVYFNRISLLAALVFAVFSTSAPAAGDDTPFAALDGAWSGTGNVRLENGKSERLKCRGYYNSKAGGQKLGLAINCGNAGFRINMRATLNYEGGRVSGTWEEREFNQSGRIGGKADADNLSLSISGAISGKMSIQMDDSNSQTVTISTGGPGFTGVDLQFAKSG